MNITLYNMINVIFYNTIRGTCAICLFFLIKEMTIVLKSSKFVDDFIQELFFRDKEWIENNSDLRMLDNQNEKQQQHEQPKAKKFEDKYLDEYKKLDDDTLLLDADEEILKKQKFSEFKEDAIKIRKTKENELMENIKNLRFLLSNKQNLKKYLDDYWSAESIVSDSEDGDAEIVKNPSDFYDFNEEELKCKNKLIELEDELKNLIIFPCDSEFEIQAHDAVISLRRKRLKNSFVMEKTPIGNVIMTYNSEIESFVYYSDNTMPYRFLEVVARKYVIINNCKNVYIDMNEVLKESEELLKKKKERKLLEEEERKKEEQQKMANATATGTIGGSGSGSGSGGNKKDVFAKFKSYNTNNSKAVAGAAPSKNSVSNTNTNNSNSDDLLLKERSNRYTCEGKIINFPILKKVEKKVVDKRYALSFADFKKLQTNNKK